MRRKVKTSLIVTSYAEVWIEIMLLIIQSTAGRRHLLRGGVDWNFPENRSDHTQDNVTSYAEVWIEIILNFLYWSTQECHLLRGGVDWNALKTRPENLLNESPPTRRCGLKYPHGFVFPVPHASPPTRRCGLKSFIYKFLHRICLSPPTRRWWSK